MLRSTLYHQASKPLYIFINRFAAPPPLFFSSFIFPENTNIGPFGNSSQLIFPLLPACVPCDTVAAVCLSLCGV